VIEWSPGHRLTDGRIEHILEQTTRHRLGRQGRGCHGRSNLIGQSLAARLVAELHVHLSPLLLGEGTRLFDLVGTTTLVQRVVTESPRARHLTYGVLRNPALG
jgi:hypothetical protein